MYRTRRLILSHVHTLSILPLVFVVVVYLLRVKFTFDSGKSVTCDNVTSKSGVLLISKWTISECPLAPDLRVSTKPE